MKDTVMANCYAVFTRAVEEGVAYGWNRAHKHTATPSPEAIKEAIEQAVVNEVCEYFNFSEFPPEEQQDE